MSAVASNDVASNDEQYFNNVVKTISTAIDKGRNIFISGVGGCGKSYLIKHLHKLYKTSRACVLTSTTGISAYNLGGVTVHSWCKIVIPSGLDDPLRWAQQLVQKLQRRTKIAQRYRTTKMLFIDEVSMLGSNYMDVLNYVCQSLRGNDKMFGGIQLVLGGDMMQLAPVKDDFPFESASWPLLKLQYFRLTKAWRFDNQRWVDLLHRVRIGTMTEEDKQLLKARLHAQVAPNTFPPIFLASTNDIVDSLNHKRLNELSNPTFTFKARDYLVKKDLDDNVLDKTACVLPEEIRKQFMVDDVLDLKEGAQVMLLANLSVEDGLTNGTRGIVKSIRKVGDDDGVVTVDFETGVTTILPHQFLQDHKDECYARIAFPLKLAFATSIHKSQSLTLSSVDMDIGSGIFCEGQSYVALSRCKSYEGLYIRSLDIYKIKPNPKALRFEQDFLSSCVNL